MALATIVAVGMRIRLIRKFALRVNGIDLSNLKVGDVIDLPDHPAKILLAEQWAEAVAETMVPAQPQPTSSSLN
jgi:hypothetical protein